MNCIQPQGSPLVVTHNRKQIKVNLSPGGNDPLNCPSNAAVFIRGLCKNYGSGPPILQNLCMNVRKGTIYGLLGASGCGKTTILSCIVGLQTWNSGELLVFGKKPGTKGSGIPGKKLGYMPQDLALYDHLSIREMIQFYGRIYNMTSTEITERWIFLTRLLQLSADFKLISELSGGQKRRASLCLALMQAPELIILDEPTVGLDPLLRRSIWNHLYKIVSTLKTTIIITTHYIEEAKLSNTIGIVRKGRLLVEDTPSRLLKQFNMNSLEDVVLQLCRKDEDGIKNLSNSSDYEEGNKVIFKSSWKERDSSDIIADYELKDGIFRNAVGFDCDLFENFRRKEDVVNSSWLLKLRHHPLYESFQRIRGLTTVILLTFVRHPVFIILLLCLPAIHGSLTLRTVGTKPKHLNLGIINNEANEWMSECDLPRHYGNSCDFSILSCKFLNKLKEDALFDLKSVDSVKDAEYLAQRGELWGYLTFPYNYSQHTVDLVAAKQFAFNESIEGSRIHVYLDYSQYIAAYFMVKDLANAYGDYMRNLADSCQLGGSGKEAEVPLFFREPVYGHNEDNYTEFLMPGVLLICMIAILCCLTALIFIRDRKQGTLNRARVAGLQTSDVMISHMLTQGLVAFGQIALWTFILHFSFDFVIVGPAWLYLLICIMAGLCGASLGIFVGILVADEIEALIIAVFLCPFFLLFGGVFWPIEAIPMGWRYMGYLLPTTLPIVSLRSVIVRGATITHPFVWPGILVLLGWTIVFTIGVLVAYKKCAR